MVSGKSDTADTVGGVVKVDGTVAGSENGFEFDQEWDGARYMPPIINMHVEG